MKHKRINEGCVHSTLLDFTLVIYHDAAQFRETNIKSLVCQSFGPILEWTVQERSHIQEQKPNLREPTLKVFCKTDATRYSQRNYSIHNVYASRLDDWLKRIDFYQYPNQRPWIELDSNEAFPLVRAPSHENVVVYDCCFGSLVWNSLFMSSVTLGSDLVGSFFHDIQYFEVTSNKMDQVRVSYRSIRRIIVNNVDNSVEIIFQLAYPPFINSVKPKNGNVRANTVRVQTLPKIAPNTIGLSNALKVKLPKTENTSQIVSRLYFRCGKKPIAYTRMSFLNTQQEPKTELIPQVDLGIFKCTYMLRALLGRTSSLQVQQGTSNWDSLVEYLRSWAREDPENLYLVLCDLVAFFDEGAILDYIPALQLLKQFYLSKQEELHLRDSAYITPDNTRHIWRATITPTRCVLGSPTLLFENRILRNFDSDYACRVIFRDDNGSRLNMRAASTDHNFYRMTIIAPMVEGIVVGPRKFCFLGWSNSQIREHGVWTYAQDSQGNTVENIRKWMGDFAHIPSVPKFMARMGQCFSQTKKGVTIPLSLKRIRLEHDVLRGVNPENGMPYCFTDGVGKISSNLLNKVCEALNYEGEVNPSAIQFRYGGCKGMLVLDPTLEDVDIIFRKSQHKFSCPESQDLEICKVSGPLAVNLNRQLIAILGHLGIHTAVFLKLQEDMLQSATEILFEPEKAMEYLCSRCALCNLSYRELDGAGVELNSEPFFRRLLLALHIKVVQGIKSKARLEIDPQFGRNMFGVVDETGQLEYGQVFVKYSTDVSKQLTTADSSVLVGKVLVTKNPCMQPGDVRILEAVDIPELHHICDCIVFPQNGPRPHPNEMSGSDLDGDEYTVIWDKSLLFTCGNAPASHFPVPQEQFKEGPIDEKDMLEFLCNYIRDDQVGLIGHAHLAKNDYLGFDHSICKKIARKFSIAVDFPKNGQLVTLDKEELVNSYPDFMEKEGRKPSYRSKKTLGKLYRVCKDFQDEGCLQGLAYEMVKVDPDFMYPGWENFKDSATGMRNRYNRLLDLLLKSNGLNHEAEAIAQANVQLQEKRDRAEVEELVLQSLKTIWVKMRKEFLEEFGGNNSDEILQKASACYFVTYNDPKPSHLSFPWVLSTYLLGIKGSKRVRLVSPLNKNPNSSFKSRLNSMLNACIDENQVAPLTTDVEAKCRKQCQELEYNMPSMNNLLLCMRVIIHWADHYGVISENQENVKHFPISMLVKTFMLVADKRVQEWRRQELSVIDMLLRYFRDCMNLQFQIARASKGDDPSLLKKIKFLGRKAMYTYHCLAVTGNLTSLGLSLSNDSVAVEELEMDPICLSSKLVAKHKRDNFDHLINHLTKVSGATRINIREQGHSKYLLSAIGQLSSLKAIKNTLSKSLDKLINLGEA